MSNQHLPQQGQPSSLAAEKRSRELRLAGAVVVGVGVVILGILAFGAIVPTLFAGFPGTVILNVITFLAFLAVVFVSLVFVYPITRAQSTTTTVIAIVIASVLGTVAKMATNLVFVVIDSIDGSWQFFERALFSPLRDSVLYFGVVGFAVFVVLAFERNKQLNAESFTAASHRPDAVPASAAAQTQPRGVRLAVVAIGVASAVILAAALIAVVGDLVHGHAEVVVIMALVPPVFFVAGAYLSLVYVSPPTTSSTPKRALTSVAVAGGAGAVAMVATSAIMFTIFLETYSNNPALWFYFAIVTPLIQAVYCIAAVGFGVFVALGLEREKEGSADAHPHVADFDNCA